MEQRPSIPTLNQDLDIRLFLKITGQNIRYIFIIFLLCSSAAFLILRYSTPEYQSNAIIQLTDENEEYNFLGQEKFIDENLAKELEFLRSPVFLTRTFDSLPLRVTYFNQGTIINHDSYNNGPFKVDVSATNPLIYGTPIYIDFKSLTSYIISYELDGEKLVFEGVVNSTITTPHFTINLAIRNADPILSPENKYFIRLNDPKKIVQIFGENLNISILNESAKTIKISNIDINPYRSADIVNAVAREFEFFNLEKKKESANRIIEYIDNTVGLVKDKLSEADSSLSAFKRQNNITDIKIDPFFNRNVEVLREFENRVYELEIQLLILKDIQDRIHVKEFNIFEILTLVSQLENQGFISNIVNQINALITRKEQIKYSVKDNSKEIKEINYQLETQISLLQEGVNAVEESIKQKIADLKGRIKQAENDIFSVDGATPNEVELAQLQRVYEVNEKYYNELISKKAEYSLAREGYTPGYRILQMASISEDPISPKRTLVITVCLIIALSLSFGIIITKYLLHDKILAVNDIIKYTNAPFLGMVPKVPEDIPISQLVVDKRPKSMMAEAFRTLRSNLEFINNESGPKLISITSTISGEGKTFVSINLAGILAFTGKKVVIIDADMRKPKIHLGFNSQNEKGLSTLLIGRDTKEECLQKSELENLYIITAGPIPPNPSELMLSDRMTKLIEDLKQEFDYILIDNPPLGIVTDAITNISRSDYPIYVFRSDYSRRFFINNLERLIREVRVENLSFVLNGVDMRQSNRYSYGYGYGSYGYGYGYGYTGYGYYEENTQPKKRKKGLGIFKKSKNV